MEKDCNNNQQKNLHIFTKLKNTLYSILFDLPFENYQNLYVTGKIHKMDLEEKKQMIYIDNHKKLKRLFFSKLINIRPTILDDEDYVEYNNLIKKSKQEKGIIIFGFFGLNSWTFYMVSIKKEKFLLNFLIMNLFLIGMLYYSGYKIQKFYDRMYQKYDKDIVNNELEEKMKILFEKKE